MNFKLLLPFKVFAEKKEVTSIVAETPQGSFGILPHRLDCVSVLAPGILSYETEKNGIEYIAIDEGILVKAGDDVLVSVRNAVGGTDLGELHEAVEREFVSLHENEKSTRAELAKMEGRFVRRFTELQKMVRSS